MNESILDRLDRDPGGARDYVAQLHVYGANRKAICAKLATRFDIAEPTPRSLTNWLNGDEALLEKIAELESIKRDMDPADAVDPTDLLPEPVNRAQVDDDLFTIADEHPAFAALFYRLAPADSEAEPESVWGTAAAAADVGDASLDDVAAVLPLYGTPEFEQECIRRLPDNWDTIEPESGAGVLVP